MMQGAEQNPKLLSRKTKSMANKLEQENKELKSKIEELQSRLNQIEQSQQQKTKFQLWLGRVGLGFLLGSGLKSSMRELYSQLPGNVKRNTLADVTTNVIWRVTRIGLFGLLIALIPIFLLWKQNQLFERQNEKMEEQTKLFEKQNEKIDNQIHLEESNRRGNLIVMISNVMDKVDEELKEDWNNDGVRNLSPQLIGRITGLSQSFRPYLFWQDSILSTHPLSPERGQLLAVLGNSKLALSTYDEIYENVTFEAAYLEDVVMTNGNYKKAYLSESNMKYAYLRNADFTQATLSYSDLSEGYLVDTKLKGADLNQTDLTNTVLIGADLRSSDLREAILKGVDLREALLNDVKVQEINWIDKLSNWNVKGIEEIKLKYFVDTIAKKDYLGNNYYLIKPRS